MPVLLLGCSCTHTAESLLCFLRACARRDKLLGLPLILRYIVRAGSCGLSSGLYASDALSSTQVCVCLCVVGCGRAPMSVSVHGGAAHLSLPCSSA